MFRSVEPFFCWPILFALLAVSNEASAQFTHPARGCILDPPDIIIGPPDPGAVGPFDTLRTEYNLGNSAADLPDFPHPVELRAEVTYPQQLGCGPFPMVFIMHGGHATCLGSQGGQKGGWPCEPVDQSQEEFCGSIPADLCDPDDPTLPNYKGYRYLADRLASQGMVVVSISANGINEADVFNADARAQLFRRHFGLWTQFSAFNNPIFGTLFVDRVDLKRVGVIGHSRGGSGAARLVDLVKEQKKPFQTIAAKGAGVKIKAVLLVGPTPGDDDETLQVTDTALGVILPYCDGDQDDLPGTDYFDASRYALVGDSGPKHSFQLIGTHNAFNTLWDPNTSDIEAIDDWVNMFGDDGPYCQDPENEPASGRLTSDEQHGAMIAISSAFFRTYLRNEKAFRSFLRSESPPPPSAMTDDIFIAYHPKDEPEDRLDVNRITDASNVTLNTLNGEVEDQGLVTFEFCDPDDMESPSGCLTEVEESFRIGQAPHYYNDVSTTQLRIGWHNGISKLTPIFTNHLPEGFRDVSAYRAIQFRAFVDMASPLNPFGQAQDLRISLTDGAGLTADVVVSNHSSNLFYPPSVEAFTDEDAVLPTAILNTVRVPLSAFHNVFLTDVRRIDLVFDQTLSGAINLADLAFADEANNKPPQITCELSELQLMGGGDELVNVGLNAPVADDKDIGLVPDVAVFSDEDDIDSQPNQSSPDAKDLATETLRLRAERDVAADGRVYLVTVTATDGDGALGHACCTAIIPKSNSPADVDGASVQAMEALALCTGFAAASEGLASVPPGYFVVGDGPVIGPNQ